MADHEHRQSNGLSEADTQRDPDSPLETTPAAPEESDLSSATRLHESDQQLTPAESSPTSGDREPDWHVEAGRKGGQRFHQLIQRGLQYEQEHGLKRGRQRLRQLVQEGRLYEQEHGLAARGRKARGGRLSRVRADQLLQSLCRILYRLAKPAHREKIAKMLQALDGEKKE